MFQFNKYGVDYTSMRLNEPSAIKQEYNVEFSTCISCVFGLTESQ